MIHKSATLVVDLFPNLTAFERQILFFESLYNQPISAAKREELLKAHFSTKK